MDETAKDVILLCSGILFGVWYPSLVDRYRAWVRPRPLRPSERFSEVEKPINWQPGNPRGVQPVGEVKPFPPASHHVIPRRGQPYELAPREALEMPAEDLQRIEARPGGALILWPSLSEDREREVLAESREGEDSDVLYGERMI